MAFKVKATLKAMDSYLRASGYLQNSQIGEPKSSPGEYLAAAIIIKSTKVVHLTLNSTIENHVVIIRFYLDMLAQPTEQIEFRLAEVVSEIFRDFMGEYDLGATIRNVDAGGSHGPPLSATWGYTDIGGKIFRIVDITVPLIVDDSATLAA